MVYRRDKKNKKGILITKRLKEFLTPRKRKKVGWQRYKPITKQKHFFGQKNSNLKRITIILVFFLSIYFIFFSKFFLINKIDVKGNKVISKEEIQIIIKNYNINPILAIFPRNNFFLNNENDVKNSLIKNFSEIKNITIKKRFPDKLEIEIIEKNPLIIWCRLKNCFYVDTEAVAFMLENNVEMYNDKKFIKIIEEIRIEEEIENNIDNTTEDQTETREEIDNFDNQKENKKEEENLFPIKINDKVADSDFILFIINLNENIQKQTDLEIKYYKTKGVKTREIIAYTDKNTRIYFNAIDDVETQIIYLKEFLSKGLSKDEINTLEYIYLKSGNKIFYK